ncbi:MAG TPA: rhodanese-like domain-containing protein [Terracidiphilus sp.]|jgi:rhodanese-related sulfurtransferase
MRTHLLSLLVLSVTLLTAPLAARAQASPLSAATVPTEALVQPADLVKILASNDAGAVPVVLQVGSHIFFSEAHIKGAQFAGPGSQSAGLALLEKATSSLPKDKLIVLYCGCCPWNRCPNVGPAYKRLQELGYRNVKVLYIANNFGDDWVSKGYPTQK